MEGDDTTNEVPYRSQQKSRKMKKERNDAIEREGGDTLSRAEMRERKKKNRTASYLKKKRVHSARH